MAVNRKLLQGAAGAAGGLVPSEHFGVVTYYGDGSSSNKVGDGSFTVLGLPDTGTAFPYLVSEKVYSSGKYYFEINDLANGNTGTMQCMVGIVPTSFRSDMTYPWKVGEQGLFWYQTNGQLYVNGSGSGSYGTFAAGDDVAVAVDFDNNTMTLYKNGSQTGTTITGVPSGTYYMSVSTGYNQYKGKAALKETLMQYSIPSGYEAWGGDIDTSGDWSNYSEYDGTLDFQPDLVWIKDRGNAEQHILNDSTRGATKDLSTNTTAAEATRTTGFLSFNSDGFTLGSDGGGVVNDPTRGPYVAWCFKANGGTTTSGSGTRISNVVNQVNSAAGFSITTFTGANTTPTDDGNFTHGLGDVPDMFIVKTTSNTDSWFIYHKDLNGGVAPQDYSVRFTSAAEEDNVGFWNDTAPSNTYINVGSGILVNNWTYVCYAFKGIDGFSKFGSYTGNGSANGTIVETGFEPAFLMVKRTDSGSSVWTIYDNKRNTTNPRNKLLHPNLSNAEATASSYQFNFFSNGFQPNGNSSDINASGGTYIYMAFAADPDTEQPTVAKSFDIQTYNMTGGSDYDLSFAFKPQFVVTKTRDEAAHWSWGDIIRGNNSNLSSNDTNAVNTSNQWRVKDWYAGATSVTIAQHASINTSNVSYAWKADDNEATINTEGSVDSVVSANANAGFSIVKYVGNGVINQSIGHGLSAAPELYITKNLDTAGTVWVTKTTVIDGSLDELILNTSDAAANIGNTNLPTSSVIYQYNNTNLGANGQNYIVYAFHSVSNYSKIGSYTGNGGSNSITGLGFQPDFVMIKSTGSGSWLLYDSVRSVSVGDNAGTANARPYILANTSGKENGATSNNVDLDSNGFSMNTSAGDLNTNGTTYIYMAFKIN